MSLPRALEPFVSFSAVLRRNGFAVAPDQTMGFIEAVGALGPRDITDIHRAARAMLTIPKEREVEFDALFRAVFLNQAVPVELPGQGDEEEVIAFEPTGGEREAEDAGEDSEVGAEAAGTERLGKRSFTPRAKLEEFRKLAPDALPRRRSYRFSPARRGHRLDLRRTLREAARRDGEVLTLVVSRRKLRQRRILLLIDVSGSMKDRTEDLLRFAHALAHSVDRVETFTLGTRLTRITAPLAVREEGTALERVGRLVADIDGGTRIGEALQAFLAVPRFAGFARGAAVVMLSDGLERGESHTMLDATRRLSRLSWRLMWLTPLAGRDHWRPETEALAAALPHIDLLGSAADLDDVCGAVLDMARAA